MFEQQDTPRLFALAPGVDFPSALVDGLRARMQGKAPHQMAQAEVIVNTARMRRRVMALFSKGPAALLPRVTLLGEIGAQPRFHHIPQAAKPLKRRIELIALIDALLQKNPDLAARSSLFDLADSLAALLDEMQGEGVTLDTIEALQVSDKSGHWARAKQFISIAGQFAENMRGAPDAEARQRAVVLAQIALWDMAPPEHPVILAGSTGSRGTTALLMQAVARLPQGAVILPGFDRDMPEEVWQTLQPHHADGLPPEDHPQFRFAKLMDDLGVTPAQVPDWVDTPPVDPARNKVVSLALRPVPVTDGWLRDGPDLGDLPSAMQHVTLLQPQTARDEALAIALRLRKAAQDGQTAALITPDRMLTRQVTAALDRWDITPDDSAGLPLQLSPPGRFLRHVADLFIHDLTAETLLTLLKHPLTHSGVARNQHLLFTRELELHLRRKGPAFPDASYLLAWGLDQKREGGADWAAWVAAHFCDKCISDTRPATDLGAAHIGLAEAIAAGADGPDSGELWLKPAGREALKQWQALEAVMGALPNLNARDYADLFGGVMSRGDVRDRDAGHPNVLIWGTLEARVQGADLIILAGLNEGSWPEAPKPDPWLNRAMRAEAGLLLPERRIGLSAHDFQQAIAAPEVWLTRAQRSDDAQTVPSRWLNRLTNLMGGLDQQGGPDAIRQMNARGDEWLARAAQLEEPIYARPAPRPSPCPPVAARPRRLSVTEIKTLVRDPYAIYAKHVLGLTPLESLVKTADARLRGVAGHSVFEQFVKGWKAAQAPQDLIDIARTVFEAEVPWPSARLLWEARIARIAADFVTQEADRQSVAQASRFEIKGASELADLGFTLSVQADRIDIDARGGAHIYDYKTGGVPTKKQQIAFDKQLLLEAAIAMRGGFKDLHPRHIEHAAFLGVSGDLKEVPAPLDELPPDKIWAELHELIASYLSPDQGFTARRAMEKTADTGWYDQLSRFGEWDETDSPDGQEVVE